MTLGGIAVLLAEPDAEMLTRFRIRYNTIIGGPTLGVRHPPHVSILQCPFSDDLPYTAILSEVIAKAAALPLLLQSVGLNYQPVGWLFLDVLRARWLTELQRLSLKAVQAYIHLDDATKNKDVSGYSDLELASYRKFGYRYVGDAFRPHITLGRLDSEDSAVLQHLRLAFAEEVGQIKSHAQSVIFYRSGAHGVVEEILTSVDLRTD